MTTFKKIFELVAEKKPSGGGTTRPPQPPRKGGGGGGDGGGPRRGSASPWGASFHSAKLEDDKYHILASHGKGKKTGGILNPPSGIKHPREATHLLVTHEQNPFAKERTLHMAVNLPNHEFHRGDISDSEIVGHFPERKE